MSVGTKPAQSKKWNPSESMGDVSERRNLVLSCSVFLENCGTIGDKGVNLFLRKVSGQLAHNLAP